MEVEAEVAHPDAAIEPAAAERQAVASVLSDAAEGAAVSVPPAALDEPVVTPPTVTMATTASPLVADFIARLHAARAVGELPFTVEQQDGGWQQLPYREATAWYTGQTGVSHNLPASVYVPDFRRI